MADFVIEGFGQRKVITAPEGSDFAKLRERGWTVSPAPAAAPSTPPPAADRKVEDDLGPVGSFMYGAGDPLQEMVHMGHGFSPESNRAIQQREEMLQRRHVSGPARLLGAAATTTALGEVGAAGVGYGVPVVGRALGGAAAQGAIGGALQPTTSKHPVAEKIGQVATGASVGKILGNLSGYFSGKQTPKTPEELTQLGKNLQAEVIRDLGGDPAKQLSRQGQYNLTGPQNQRLSKAQEAKWNKGIDAQLAAIQAKQKLTQALQTGVPDVSTLKAIIATIGHFTHTKGGSIASSAINTALDNYFDQAAPQALRAEAARIIQRAGLTRDRTGNWFLKNLDVFAPQLGAAAGEAVDYPLAPDPLRPGAQDALRR